LYNTDEQKAHLTDKVDRKWNAGFVVKFNDVVWTQCCKCLITTFRQWVIRTSVHKAAWHPAQFY